MASILKDAELRPELFSWFGAIDRKEIDEWLHSNSLMAPEDLKEFWSETGGGDIYESETIFRPTQISSAMPYFVDGDDILGATRFRIDSGMKASYLAIHDGLYLSAIRLPDQMYVIFNDKFEEISMFTTLGERYGLPRF